MTEKDQPALRAFSYARQSVRRDAGIAFQLKENRQTIDSREWVLAGEEGDNNVSATKRRGLNSGYRRMLDAWDAGMFDVLVVTKIARLLRNAFSPDLGEIVNRKMKVCVGGMVLDLSVPQMRSIFAYQVVQSTFEVEEKEDRRAPVITAARAAGHPKAGAVPYGYRRRGPEERKLAAREKGTDPAQEPRWVIVKDQADVLREAVTEVLAHGKLHRICAALKAKNVVTQQTERRGGVPFTPSTLTRLLISPSIAGLLPPPAVPGEKFDARKINPDDCPKGSFDGIISPERWRAVRGVLLGDPSRTTNGGSTARKHLLGSIAVCSVCGLPVKSGVTRHGAPAYRCRSEKHFTRIMAPIDQYIEHMVITRLSAPDARELLRKPGSGVDVDFLRAQRVDLEQRVEQLVRSMAAKVFTLDQVAPVKRELDKQIAVITAQLTAAYAVDPLAAVIDAVDVEAAWRALDLDRRRAVVVALMTVTIRPVGNGGRVRNLDEARQSVHVAWKYDQGREEDFEDGEVPLVMLADGSYVPAVFGSVEAQVAFAVG